MGEGGDSCIIIASEEVMIVVIQQLWVLSSWLDKPCDLIMILIFYM